MRLSVVLVCGLLLVAGCSKRGLTSGSAKVREQLQAGGQLFLNPNQGDVLTWVDPTGQPLPATFPHGTPCAEGSQTAVCTINVASGYYLFTCRNCIDPGIAVGGSNAPASLDVKPHPTAHHAETPFIYCDSNTAAADKVTAAVGDTIQWFGSGTINTWTVTVANGTCTEGTTFTPSSPVCSVAAGAASNPYQVTTSLCQVQTGTSTITIH